MDIPATCKSCRHFGRDRTLYATHVAMGLGHCAFDKAHGKSLFRWQNHTCDRYDPTARRRAYLEAKGLPWKS
jgi:hypothetical protein